MPVRSPAKDASIAGEINTAYACRLLREMLRRGRCVRFPARFKEYSDLKPYQNSSSATSLVAPVAVVLEHCARIIMLQAVESIKPAK